VPNPRAELISLYSRMGRELAAVRMAEDQAPGQRPLISAAVRNALRSGTVSTDTKASVVFEPGLEVRRTNGGGLQTLAELNEAAASSAQAGILAALVEAASGLGNYDRAIALERLRAMQANTAEETAAIQKRLTDMVAAKKARELGAALLFHVDRRNTTESVYAAQVIEK
jgi:hypothetical protein